MKMITAMIQPFMLYKVSTALEEIADFPGMTIEDVQGLGRNTTAAHHDASDPDRVTEEYVEYAKKTRIEIVARDEMVERIVETIVRIAHTGNSGDGMVFVWPIENVTRIQTGESGEAAI